MRSYGKIILIGEHSVVYGHKAVAIPFTAGSIETLITVSDEWLIDSKLYRGPLDKSPEILHPIKQLIEKIQKDLELSPLNIKITSTLPISAGLGSSAAVASSVTKTIFEFIGKQLQQDILFEYVQFSERLAHGVSSGIDTLITTTGKPYIFTKDGYKKPLSFSLDAYLVIVNSNQIGQTKDAVKIVKNNVDNKNGMVNINQLGYLTESFIEQIKQGNIQELGNIMNQSAHELSSLGIETTVLKDLINDANTHGALGAKFTGSGLGGCVIVLEKSKKSAENIEKLWKSKGYQTWIMEMKEVM